MTEPRQRLGVGKPGSNLTALPTLAHGRRLRQRSAVRAPRSHSPPTSYLALPRCRPVQERESTNTPSLLSSGFSNQRSDPPRPTGKGGHHASTYPLPLQNDSRHTTVVRAKRIARPKGLPCPRYRKGRSPTQRGLAGSTGVRLGPISYHSVRHTINGGRGLPMGPESSRRREGAFLWGHGVFDVSRATWADFVGFAPEVRPRDSRTL